MLGPIAHEFNDTGRHRLRLLAGDQRSSEWTSYEHVASLPEPAGDPHGRIGYIAVTEYGLLDPAFGDAFEGVLRVERLDRVK